MKRAAIYLRVSTDEQAESGTSIGTQRDRCVAHIEAQGWALVGEYADEGVSGAKANRPQLDRMMASAEAGELDAVTVTDIDRFSRDLLDGMLAERKLAQAGVEVVYLSAPGIGALERQIRGAFAEEERRKIAERTSRGLNATAKAGGWPGGPAPFGMRLVKHEGRHTTLDIDEAEAEVIRTAARLILDGLGPWAVAVELNALGMRPRKAKRWSNTMVRRLLLNPYLGGVVTYNKPWASGGSGHRPRTDSEPIEIPCPAILDTATQAEVRLRIEARAAGPKAAARVYPLSGIMRGACGCRFNGIYRLDRDRRSYRCQGARAFRADGRCDDHYIDCDRVEAQVWQVVCELLGDAERLADLAAGHLGSDVLASGSPAESVADLDRRVTAAERALTSCMVEWAKAGMDPGAMTAAAAELNEELTALRNRRDRAAAWQADADSRMAQVDRLQAMATAAAERLPSMPDAERKQVLELLDVKVRITEWSLCGACFGSGRMSDGVQPGGISCTACSGNRWLPSLRITGAIHDAFLGMVGEPGCEAPRPWTCSRR